jgi:hypothetical protein
MDLTRESLEYVAPAVGEPAQRVVAVESQGGAE